MSLPRAGTQPLPSPGLSQPRSIPLQLLFGSIRKSSHLTEILSIFSMKWSCTDEQMELTACAQPGTEQPWGGLLRA